MVDKIFKIGLLVLGFGYLAYLFCPVANQAGRYSFRTMSGTMTVFDTTNADVYTLLANKKRWIKLNPRTGKSVNVAIVTDTKKTNK